MTGSRPRIPYRWLWFAATLAALSLGLFAEQDKKDESDPHGADPEVLAKAVELADKIMSHVARSDLETRNFYIATDVTSEGILRQLASSLEGAYYTIDKVLDLPIAKTDSKVKAYLFAHSSQHYGLMGFSRGGYLRPGMLAFYRGDSDTQELLGTLVHEASHAFVDQFIVQPDVQLPLWLDEGFASYMGYSLVLDGKIQPGVFYAQHRQDYLNTTAIGSPPAAEAAKRVARRIKQGSVISLEKLLSADRRTFYSGLKRDYYDLAWAFVHYLRHGLPEDQQRFSSLMAAFARGLDATAAFGEVYGRTPSSMESSFHDYVRTVLSKPAKAPPAVLREPPTN